MKTLIQNIKVLKPILIISLLLMFYQEHLVFAAKIPVWSVHEVIFQGESYSIESNPVRDIELLTVWQHTQSRKTIEIYGFYDGNGKGTPAGNCFKIRFCPIKEGEWTLIRVSSNDKKLQEQHVGLKIQAVASKNPGFWVVDAMSSGCRWYKRSDGSHPYITGNTMYTFLSEFYKDKPTGSTIKKDILNNSLYYKKIRFAVTADRYPNPMSKPFLDESGKPTDDGNYSYRPNPEWFYNRVDLAISTALKKDLIADMILNGPDTEMSRSVLKAGKNNGDITPFLRYIAARYGSFPNVWICLSNEFDIKKPSYKPEKIIEYGKIIHRYLPYNTPVSVHAVADWSKKLNSSISWFDHVIVQSKLKNLDKSADKIIWNYHLGGSNQPVVNDELAYQGKGDGWSEHNVIEAFTGAFMGGGYASTGYKPTNKGGHYFSGNFTPEEHTASDNLRWLREIIEKNISFWKMAPVEIINTNFITKGRHESKIRIMEYPGYEYLVACSSSDESLTAQLPQGRWNVKSYDAITKTEKTIAKNISGNFQFKFNGSRALMFHFKRNDKQSSVKRRFIHPGMLHSISDLNFLKNKVNAKSEPWLSAWNELRKSPAAQLSYKMSPQNHVARGPYNKPDIGATSFLKDGAAAYTMALQWIVLGDRSYAKKAIEIINGWSHALDSITMGDRKLLIGMAGIHYLNAAEIIKHTYNDWSEKEQKVFESMILNIWYPIIQDFQPGYNGNWDAAIGQTMLCIGIFLDRHDIFDKAYEHLLKGNSNGSLAHYFMPNGQCQESGRDQYHTQMGLGFLSAAAEIAWKQGFNLYGAYNNRLAAGYEYTAQYLSGAEVPYVQYKNYKGEKVFGMEISPKGRGKYSPIYERAYRHYHDRMGLEMPYTKKALGHSRTEGLGSSHMSWSTLLNASYPPEE